MRNITRALVGLLGLFNLVIGFGFLLYPAKMCSGFFLSPIGTQGLASLRADFPSFFITSALFALYGAWRGRCAPLLVPLIMIAIALSGRIIGLIVDGAAPTAFPPMVVEAVMMAILLAGYRVLGRS